MSTRTVTLYSTKGGKQKVETDAKTWGELKPLVEKYYDLKKLQPTENVNKTTLTHQEAVLPEGDFILFLRPIRTKSGMDGVEGLSFQELRKLVTNDDIKSHLNQYSGKNWTRLSTEELRAGLAAYHSEAIEEDEMPLKQDSIPEEEKVKELTLLERIEIVHGHLEKLEEEVTEIPEKLSVALCKKMVESLQNHFSEEEEETSKEDAENLDEEYKNFMKGFDD